MLKQPTESWVSSELKAETGCVRFAGPPLETRRTPRTQQVVLLKAMIYYSKRKQSKINRGKSCLGEVLRKPSPSFQQSPLIAVTQAELDSSAMSCDSGGKCCLPGNLRVEVPRDFTGSWPHRHPWPIMYPTCRPQKENNKL